MPGCRRQCAPHFLFDLAEKKTGRARSNRKERLRRTCAFAQVGLKRGSSECVPPSEELPYRHTANLGCLKVPLPACRSLVETSREIPDTPPSSFRWRYPGGLLGFHPPPDKAQANLEEQPFRQPPRGLRQTHNRGVRPAQVNSPARAGRRLPKFCRHIFGRPPY